MSYQADTVKLEPGDGGSPFAVLGRVAMMSKTLTDVIEAAGTSTVIPLPNITGKILEKVILWCKHHDENDKPEPAPEAGKTTELCTWDIEFLKIDNAVIFDLILAANYLDITMLLKAGCKAIAAQIKGKKPEEIRKIFNIPNDFTKEEEDRVRKENVWVDDEAAPLPPPTQAVPVKTE